MFPYQKPSFAQTIGAMIVGDSGYTLPWAIQLLENNEGYIRSSYPLSPKKSGTSMTYVERRPDGWYCDPETLPKSYQTRVSVRQAIYDIPLNFMPTHTFPSEAVVTLHFDGKEARIVSPDKG